MSIEEQVREYIVTHYGSLRAFAAAIGKSPSTVTAFFNRGFNNSSFTNILQLCQALHISVDALANGEIVRICEHGQPLPSLPPHDQALLDAYHAMSSQEQQMVCRMVGIKHPDEKQKKNKQHA